MTLCMYTLYAILSSLVIVAVQETSLRLRQVSDSDTASGQKQKQAELVGKRIRAIGDEFMAQFLSEPGMKDLVEA